MYSSKYFAHYLALNKLLMPSLFVNIDEVDLFYNLLELKKKGNSPKKIRSTTSLESFEEV